MAHMHTLLVSISEVLTLTVMVGSHRLWPGLLEVGHWWPAPAGGKGASYGCWVGAAQRWASGPHAGRCAGREGKQGCLRLLLVWLCGVWGERKRRGPQLMRHASWTGDVFLAATLAGLVLEVLERTVGFSMYVHSEGSGEGRGASG